MGVAIEVYNSLDDYLKIYGKFVYDASRHSLVKKLLKKGKEQLVIILARGNKPIRPLNEKHIIFCSDHYEDDFDSRNIENVMNFKLVLTDKLRFVCFGETKKHWGLGYLCSKEEKLFEVNVTKVNGELEDYDSHYTLFFDVTRQSLNVVCNSNF